MTTFVEAIQQVVEDMEQKMIKKARKAFCITECDNAFYTDCSCSEYVRFKQILEEEQ